MPAGLFKKSFLLFTVSLHRSKSTSDIQAQPSVIRQFQTEDLQRYREQVKQSDDQWQDVSITDMCTAQERWRISVFFPPILSYNSRHTNGIKLCSTDKVDLKCEDMIYGICVIRVAIRRAGGVVQSVAMGWKDSCLDRSQRQTQTLVQHWPLAMDCPHF